MTLIVWDGRSLAVDRAVSGGGFITLTNKIACGVMNYTDDITLNFAVAFTGFANDCERNLRTAWQYMTAHGENFDFEFNPRIGGIVAYEDNGTIATNRSIGLLVIQDPHNDGMSRCFLVYSDGLCKDVSENRMYALGNSLGEAFATGYLWNSTHRMSPSNTDAAAEAVFAAGRCVDGISSCGDTWLSTTGEVRGFQTSHRNGEIGFGIQGSGEY